MAVPTITGSIFSQSRLEWAEMQTLWGGLAENYFKYIYIFLLQFKKTDFMAE
jgi:hypothetical protein